MLRAIIGGLVAVSFVIGGPVLDQAQDQDPNATSVTFLDTVVVTAGRSEEQVKSLSVPVTVIDEKDIERTNAQTLPELLKQYGVLIIPAGAGTGSAKVSIRGFATNSNPNESGTILILLDGRRIGNNNIGFIPVQNIGRVEIIRGAASAQYGSEATGGVINMISKRGGEKFTAFVEQSFGSWDRQRTQLGFSGMLGKFDFSAGGSYYESDDVDVGGDKGKYYNTKVNHRYLGGLNVGYNFNEDHRLGLVYNYSDGEYARSGNYVRTRNAAQNPFGMSKRSQKSWDLKYDGALPEENLSWMARYYKGEVTYETSTNWPKKTGYYEYVGDFDGASVSGSWNNGLLYLTGGLDYYKIDYTKTTTPPPSAYQQDYAAFLIAKVGLLDDTLWFNTGLRYDWYEIESGAYDSSNAAKQSKSRATPSFGVSYMPLDWLKLRANYSTSFKMPEPISQMNFSDTGTNTYLANPDLQPETSKGWEVGGDVYYEGLTLGLTYFSVDYKKKIESREVAPKVRQYQNLPGTTEYRGLEASFEWNMGQTFGWNFDLKPYVSATRMFRYFNTEMKKNTGFVSDFSASYGLAFEDPDIGLTASVDATYFGHQMPHYTTAQVEFGGHTVVDLHLAKRLYDWDDKGRLILKLDVLNLNDRYYETQRNYAEEGRSFMLGLRYEY